MNMRHWHRNRCLTRLPSYRTLVKGKRSSRNLERRMVPDSLDMVPYMYVPVRYTVEPFDYLLPLPLPVQVVPAGIVRNPLKMSILKNQSFRRHKNVRAMSKNCTAVFLCLGTKSSRKPCATRRHEAISGLVIVHQNAAK